MLKGDLGRLFFGIGAFEIGNVAATLLILRAVQLLTPEPRQRLERRRSRSGSTSATTPSPPPRASRAGTLGDRRGNLLVLTLGAVAFAAAFVGFALTGPQIGILAVCFVVAGLGIGFAETAEHAAVATLRTETFADRRSERSRRSSRSATSPPARSPGILFTAVSPRAAFLYLAAWMIAAVVAFVGVHVRPVKTA